MALATGVFHTVYQYCKTYWFHCNFNTRFKEYKRMGIMQGLFFDLAGAVYSGVASSGKFDPMMLSMLAWILPGIVSYYYWHKKTVL